MSFEKIISDIKDNKIKTNLNITKRRLWPNYCYHFTNIDNALEIFKANYLYSRKRVQTLGRMSNENANRDIIANTQPKVFDYVRLYFRPQVPTLFRNEGFRAKDRLQSASCPFPIYFLFDLSKVLELPNAYFSAVSLAIRKEPELLSGEEAFSKLPFELIYNDTYFSRADRNKFVSHEQAEIVVSEQLSLQFLEKVIVRSHAERDTLKQLLQDNHLDQFLDRVEVDEDGTFFFKRWSYVNEVLLESDKIHLSTHVGQDAYPENWLETRRTELPESADSYIDYRVIVIDSNKKKWRWPFEHRHSLLKPNFVLSLDNVNDDNYEVRVYLDNQLAYFGKHDQAYDLPF